LGAYFDAWRGKWPVHEVLDLYEASQLAFDSTVSAGEALRHFEKIYNELERYWQVYRSPLPGAVPWPPQQVFETIKREFPEFVERTYQPTQLPGARDRAQSPISPR